MRNYRLLMLVGISVASLFSGLLPAIAAPDLTYSGASTYKDAKDNIYIISSSEKEITYSDVAVTKAPYSDACGFISLKLSNSNSPFPSALAFNGTSNTVGSIPVVTEKSPYKCVNGVAQWKGTAQTSIFQTSVTNANGSITVKNIYYPPSSTGGAFKQGLISYTATLTKNPKPNACGFIVTPGYANSQKKTSGTLSINGSSINIATLPINPNPPDCVGGKTLVGGANTVATFNGASLYRTSKAIYFTGLTPKSLNVVGYDAMTSKSYPPFDPSCGLFSISYKKLADVPVSIKIGTMNYTTATMTDQNSPNCAAAVVNTLYKSGRYFSYKTTDPNQKKLVVETPSILTKNIAVNDCGFAVIPALNMANGFTAGDKVAINGSTAYDVMTLPLAPTAPTCKNGVTYLISN
jgi:hypothetical protein